MRTDTPAPSQHGPYTVADWLAFDRARHTKHELRNGILVERGGGPYAHNLISGQFLVTLGRALERVGSDCGVLCSGQKVFVNERTGYYPDGVIVCGPPQIDFGEALRNPVAVVEVLSDSTSAFDRGVKSEDYLTLESLRYYVMVDQYRPHVECYERGESA